MLDRLEVPDLLVVPGVEDPGLVQIAADVPFFVVALQIPGLMEEMA